MLAVQVIDKSGPGKIHEVILVKTNLTSIPSLASPPPSLLFFRAPFYFAPLPTI